MPMKILTANDLHSGEVVYLKNDGLWSSYITQAQLSGSTSRDEKLLALGHEAEENRLVVGPFLIDVEIKNEIPVPVRFREQLRVTGPPTKAEFAKPSFAPELKEVA